jgi:hypothetical protein
VHDLSGHTSGTAQTVRRTHHAAANQQAFIFRPGLYRFIVNIRCLFFVSARATSTVVKANSCFWFLRTQGFFVTNLFPDFLFVEGTPSKHFNRWNKRDLSKALQMSEQDKDPRQNVPCVFFRKGSCRNGASCPFLHELKSPVAEKSAASTKAPASRNIIVELKPGLLVHMLCDIRHFLWFALPILPGTPQTGEWSIHERDQKIMLV